MFFEDYSAQTNPLDPSNINQSVVKNVVKKSDQLSFLELAPSEYYDYSVFHTIVQYFHGRTCYDEISQGRQLLF